MKTLIFLFNTLLICNNVFSQNILDSKNSWSFLEVQNCEKSANCDNKSYENHRFFITNDTIVNDKTYKVLMQTTIKSNDNSQNTYPIGFIREDNIDKKIYFLETMPVKPEVLLYDFAIKKDEVFTNPYFSSKVANTDSILLNGNKRLRIQFDVIRINNIGKVAINDTLEWIEGIGSRQGLVDYFYDRHILICFEQNNVMEYSNIYGFDCSYSGSTGIQINNLNKTIIFPNPTTQFLNIQSDNSINTLRLYRITGELVKLWTPKTSQCQIDLTGIEKGLYILKTNSDFNKLIKE